MSARRIVGILAATLAIFSLDSLTPLGTPTWVLYLIPVLYVSLRAARNVIIWYTALVTILVWLDFFLSPPGILSVYAIINRVLWIASLWILALFSWRRNQMAEALQTAYQQLRESEANLRTVFNSAFDAMLVHDLSGRIIEANAKALEMYGLGRHQALSLSISDLSAPDNPLDIAADIWRKAAAGEKWLFEWKGRRPADGTTFDAEVSLAPIRLKNRTVILGTVRDITARRQMEEELRLTRFAVDNASVCAFLVDRDARLLYVNGQTCRTLGYTREELLAMTVHDLDPDFPRARWESHWAELKQKGRLQFETTQRRKDGTLISLELSLNFLSFKGREYNVAFGLDISQRKKAEAALRTSEANYRAIFEAANDAIFVHHPESGEVMAINRKALEMYGFSQKEFRDFNNEDLFARQPGYTAREARERIRHAAAGQPQLFEWLARKKSGELFWVEVNLKKVVIGGEDRLLAIVRDISARKQAEREIARVSRRNELVLNTAGEGILGLDSGGVVTFINPAAAAMLGYGEDELLGRQSHGMWHHHRPDGTPYPVEECPIYQAYRDGTTQQGEEVFWRKDGTPFPVDFTSMPFRENGLAGAVVTFRDISERKRAEAALREAYAGLELKVRERTRELARTNSELRLEIAERRKAEELIRGSKELSDGLNQLATLIHSTLDLKEIMEQVVERAARILQVDAAMIGGFEEGEFRVQFAWRLPEVFTNRKLTSNELRAIQHVARHRDVLAFNQADQDERLNLEFVRRAGIRALLVAPLLTGNEVVGVLAFYGLSRQIRFTEEHLDFARKLGGSISLALENGRLYQALMESEKLSSSRLGQLKTIYDTAPIGLCFIDRDYRYVSINERLARINGIPVRETLGRTVREVLPRIAPQVETFCSRVLATGKPIEEVEISGRSWAENRPMTVLCSFYPVRDQGEISGLNIVVQDITARKRMEEALQASERRLRAIVDSIPDMAWLKDKESRFILVNEAFGAAAGKSPGELIGKTDFEAWPPELAARYRADDQEVLATHARKRVEEPLAGPQGRLAWIETIKTPIYDEQGEVMGTAGIARDITERRRMEEEIRHMAQHDVLTGLPNRRLLMDITGISVAEARRHRSKLAILFLDLDRFKEVNDTLGHEAGDQLLKEVAGRLKSVVRESDAVARIGGDEFNILLTDLATVENAASIVRKLIDCFQTPFQITGHELQVTTSIGISIYPDDGTEIETLFRYADIALYHAKESGKNTYQFYDPAINVRSVERMRMECSLRQALNRGELEVHYQAQVDVRTREILCVEALVRWDHPEIGLLASRQFIPLAEEAGFVTAVDEWVLRAACVQLKAWGDSGLPGFCVTVNLSARQFQNPQLVATIAHILDETGLPPEYLDLEITESTAMQDIERAIGRLNQLADMGVRISIDDFGTGYSSLNYLKRMPIQRLKIDRSFIKDIETDPDDRAIIRAVVAMAHNLRMRVIAEGVETEEQLKFLEEIGCDEAQGYFFSRPLPAQEFENLMAMVP